MAKATPRKAKYVEKSQMHSVCYNQLRYTFVILTFMRGPIILKWIIISSEKNWSVKTSPLDLSTLVVSWLTYSPCL